MKNKKHYYYYYLYEITNLSNKMFYIGVHSTINVEDGLYGFSEINAS